MRLAHRSAGTIGWIAIITVLAMVLAAGLYTRMTLTSVERILPTILLDQLQALSRVSEGLSEVIVQSALVQKEPSEKAVAELARQVDDVYDSLVALRQTYVFDNLVQASTFHDAVAPALVDARQWLTHGVSGYPAHGSLTLNIVHSRLRFAQTKAWQIRSDSHASAQDILKKQRERLEKFLRGVNLFMVLSGLVFLLVLTLLFRHRILLKSESIAQSERRLAERNLRNSEERAVRQRKAIADLALDPVVHSDDKNAAFSRLVETACKTIHVARANIWQFSKDETVLECVAFFGVDHTGGTPGRQLRTADFPNYFEIFRKEGRMFVEDALHDDRMQEFLESYLIPMGITATLDAGIISQGRLVGIFSMAHMGGRRTWHPDEEAFAGTLAGMAAQVIFNAEHRRLTSQLRQAQKMESVGRLAGGVAHDFNNMLGVILGHVELAMGRIDETDPVHRDLDRIRDSAVRSADLTRQLLTFARKQIISPKVMDLNEAVGSTLTMLRRLIGENIHLAWHPCEGLWPVKMDPSQIDQILANLCVNARDAISGVGTITIQTGRKIFDRIYCDHHPGAVPGEYVQLSVTDDGAGMDKEIRKNLFEPFFTTKELGKGTGLGLATVYGIVKQNNGFINVYSEPGMGAVFKIYLPRHIATDRESVPEKQDPVRPVPPGSETVLLVEDEPAILEVTGLMLESLGYEVLSADTPGKALVLAETHETIHLLLTDVVMPEMNGKDLAERLAAMHPGLKCLFMSGYTADVIAHHEVLDKGVHFLQKPFSKEELAARVRNALDGGTDCHDAG
jgi:signal transduction histidine kinase/ActR/RegA family two-component response regulator